MKGHLKSIARKEWDSPTGKVLFVEFTIEEDARVFTVWRTELKDKTFGDEIEFEPVEKKPGKWEAKLAGASKPPMIGRGKSPEELKLQARTMVMAYSKDIVVAMVNKELLSAGKIDDGLVHYAEKMLGWVEK